MTWMPFVCLGIGFALSLTPFIGKFVKAVDFIINFALIVLMVTIGMNIGINDSVMRSLGTIGLKCAAIAISAILFSIIFVVAVEKTLLPLEKMKNKISLENSDLIKAQGEDEKEEKTSGLIFLMPASITLGVLVGWRFMSADYSSFLGSSLIFSLVVLYTGVGISLGSNRSVFSYVKLLGAKVLYLPLAIFIGSLTGGFFAGAVLEIPMHISVTSAAGMSYYSITGAYMTSAYGIYAGTYGFVVNVMREFFTVLLLPIIIKISKGSPIASGAAGNMDTMLVPVTKFVGKELGLVALITGVILTFFVPVLLPLMKMLQP